MGSVPDIRIFENFSCVDIIHGAFEQLDYVWDINTFLLFEIHYPSDFKAFLDQYHLGILEYLNEFPQNKRGSIEEVISIATKLHIDTNEIIFKPVQTQQENPTISPGSNKQETQIPNDDNHKGFLDDLAWFDNDNETKWEWLSDKNKKKIESMFRCYWKSGLKCRI